MTPRTQSTHLWEASRHVVLVFGSAGACQEKRIPSKKKKQQQRAEVHLALLYQLSNLQLPWLLLYLVQNGAVAAPCHCVPWARVWAESLGTTLWLNHIQFCWVPCHPHESSFCLLLRHSCVRLRARCQLSCPNPRPWTWLHIYTGMCADSLSSHVNTPHDSYVFAHIWRTDGIQQKVVNLTSVLFGPWSLLTRAFWWRERRALRFNHRCPVFHVLPVLYRLFKEVSSAATLVQRAALLTSLISRLWLNATHKEWRKGVWYHLDEQVVLYRWVLLVTQDTGWHIPGWFPQFLQF